MTMDVIGDVITSVLSDGGIDYKGVVLVTYAIGLSSGRYIELAEDGVWPTTSQGLVPDHDFSQLVGLRIVGIEFPTSQPACGIRLSDGTLLSMGSPLPYWYGLEVVIE